MRSIIFFILFFVASLTVEAQSLAQKTSALLQSAWADAEPGKVVFVGGDGKNFERPSRGQISGTLKSSYNQGEIPMVLRDINKKQVSLFFWGRGAIKGFEIFLELKLYHQTLNIKSTYSKEENGLYFIYVDLGGGEILQLKY